MAAGPKAARTSHGVGDAGADTTADVTADVTADAGAASTNDVTADMIAAALDRHRRGVAEGAAGRPAAAAEQFRAGLRLLEGVVQPASVPVPAQRRRPPETAASPDPQRDEGRGEHENPGEPCADTPGDDDPRPGKPVPCDSPSAPPRSRPLDQGPDPARRSARPRRSAPAGTSELQGAQTAAARLLTSLAHAEAELGRVERGLELLDRAERLAGADYRAVVVSQRGLLLWRAGRYQAALPCFDEAIPLLVDHPDRLVPARVLLNRGGLHLGTGRLAASRADLERSERLARLAGDEMLAAKAVHNLGYCDLLLGNIPAALDAFGRAEAAYRDRAPGNLPVLHVDRARALLTAGLAAEAASGLEAAIEAFRAQRLSQDRAEAELALAQALAAADRPADAAARARQAQRHFLTRGNETWGALAELTRLRADFAAQPNRHEGRAAALTRLATRASGLADRLANLGLPHDAAFARLLAARALIRAGKPAERIRALLDPALLDSAVIDRARLDRARLDRARLDRARSRGPAATLELRLFAHLARAEHAAARGERATALAELRRGLNRLDEQRRSLGSLDLQTGTAALGRELTSTGLRLALDSGSAGSVFAWSERSRAQAFRIRPVQPPHDPAMAAAIAEYRRLDELLRTAELRGQSDPRARHRLSALQRQLREQSWTASGAGGRPGQARVTLPEAAAELAAAGHAMISLLRQDDLLLALAIADGHATLVRLGSYPVALEAAHRLHGDLEARVARSLPARLQAVIEQSIRRQLSVLGETVIAPLRPLLRDLPVVVVPTGHLAAVPWNLVPELRDRPVTVCPSASLWLSARRARATDPRGFAGALHASGFADASNAADAAVTVRTADPLDTAGTHPGPRAVLAAGPRLAHAEAEVNAIAGLYPAPVVLTGQAATVEATLRAMDGAHTVHLAAHGHHERGNVMFARIDLADGPLMAYDLQRLATPPRQVILSACELGRADVRVGDEHLGFTAALLYAGTSTVVSSATPIPDAAAPPIMAALHSALVAGSSPAAALAAATAPDRLDPFVCFGAG